MRAIDIHNELTLLGVSSEVHALVDDLGLDVGCVPLWFRYVLKHVNQSYRTPLPVRKYVYVPHNRKEYVQGQLFD